MALANDIGSDLARALQFVADNEPVEQSPLTKPAQILLDLQALRLIRATRTGWVVRWTQIRDWESRKNTLGSHPLKRRRAKRRR